MQIMFEQNGYTRSLFVFAETGEVSEFFYQMVLMDS